MPVCCDVSVFYGHCGGMSQQPVAHGLVCVVETVMALVCDFVFALFDADQKPVCMFGSAH